MNKLLNKSVKTGLAASLLMLTACSGGGSEVEQAADAQEEFGCNVLNVFNWGEYVGEDVIENFETLYNAKVNYDMFDSNEMMYTKLLGGSSYDVLVPSDYMIEQLMDEDMLQPYDKDAMTNYGNLDSTVLDMQKVFDPEMKYAVPYFWGSVGLVYNTTTVDQAEIEEQGWEILKNPKYKGKIYFYDSQRDGFMVAFKALGYSMNTDDPDEIQAAYEWLREMNDTMEPAYVTDEVIDGMVNGNKDIAIVYSGDASYVLSENEEMGWIEPWQGTNIWCDAMVIPANAKCAGLANAFIDYTISNDVQVANSDYVGYTAVSSAAEDELSSEEGTYFEIPSYTPRRGYDKDETFRYNPSLKKQLSDLWTKVKVQ